MRRILLHKKREIEKINRRKDYNYLMTMQESHKKSNESSGINLEIMEVFD